MLLFNHGDATLNKSQNLTIAETCHATVVYGSYVYGSRNREMYNVNAI